MMLSLSSKLLQLMACLEVLTIPGGVTDLQCCLLALPEEPGLPVDMVSPLVSEMEIIFH